MGTPSEVDASHLFADLMRFSSGASTSKDANGVVYSLFSEIQLVGLDLETTSSLHSLCFERSLF